ncbi:uncharacterized protein LOC107982158 [Nasonia vitripennis]|uniref:Uncharacterized protein n=1 Tax=Nasonia vitripennis TaxID=7425 RepID=A0A7M7Q327_NASVI|nr:uncharacterized protein LOC107982158 [Nasonia vitripennis]XP_031779881.1 uncharacterized protein LOC107982158 [Nasonia vitripennis]
MDEPDDDWKKRNISEVFGCTEKYAAAKDLIGKLEAKKNLLASSSKSQPKDSYETKSSSPTFGSSNISMWYIVQLVNDEEMHIIPGFWMKDDKTSTAWPPYSSSFEDVQTSIQDREKPKSDWTNRNIAKILKKSVTYNSASNWIKEQKNHQEQKSEFNSPDSNHDHGIRENIPPTHKFVKMQRSSTKADNEDPFIIVIIRNSDVEYPAIVPKSWICDKGKTVKWPPKFSNPNIIALKQTPKEDWFQCNLKDVYWTTATFDYEEDIQKVKIAENLSGAENVEEAFREQQNPRGNKKK